MVRRGRRNKMKLVDVIRVLLSSPNIACQVPIYEKYDKSVQGNTVWERGVVAASICAPFMDFPELPEDRARTGVAIATGGNPNFAKISAKAAAKQAVFHAVWKLACVGATPFGATDCLNFGNPEKPDQMGDFVSGVDGVREACEALGVPIVSGNVSLYNESDGKAIPPSALVSVFGRILDPSSVPTLKFQNEGNTIFLIGNKSLDLGGSAFLEVLGKKDSRMPCSEMDAMIRQVSILRELAAKNQICTAHPIGLGGGIISLCKACFLGRLGVDINIPSNISSNISGFLFGEDLGAVIATDQPGVVFDAFGDDVLKLGYVSGGFSMKIVSGDVEILDQDLTEWNRLWKTGLRDLF